MAAQKLIEAPWNVLVRGLEGRSDPGMDLGPGSPKAHFHDSEERPWERSWGSSQSRIVPVALLKLLQLPGHGGCFIKAFEA